MVIEKLQDHFVVCQKNDTLYKISFSKEELVEKIELLERIGFITLSMISCTDWIEDGKFFLNYILTTEQRDINLLCEVQIERENSTIKSISDLFVQAEIFERDLWEMFGIEFIGNKNLVELALEDWHDIPPLRREFDTLEFVNEHFDFRGGRDDNKDVKVELKRRKDEAKKLQEEQKKLEEKENNGE
jgi:NADH-quinone oxidoreductase subunit C